MNGHPTPRRKAVWSHLLPSGQRQHRRTTLLLAVLLMAVLLAASLAIAACGSGTVSTETTVAPTDTTVAAADTTVPAPAAFPVTVTDDNGTTVTINALPQRIVSTAPANTETLFALGLGDKVVGVTSLDDYPAEVATLPKVGDYTANAEAITALDPDLVVGYSGNEEALAPIAAAGTPVLILNPTDLDGIYADITMVGEATGATAEAADLVASMTAQITEIATAAEATGEPPSVFYALDNTLYTCGPGSFVDQLLTLANTTNVGALPKADGSPADAYPQFSVEQLVASDPYIILLSGLAYPTADEFTSDARFAGLTAVKEGRVLVIDDKLLTIPGPRIGQGLKTLVEAVHPGVL
jgi:iron complex transport system substrate-binding protein